MRRRISKEGKARADALRTYGGSGSLPSDAPAPLPSSLSGAPELAAAAAGAGKRYVDVIMRVRDDGRVIPLSVCWDDGRTFRIDEVLGDPASNAAPSAAACTLRYTVRIGAHTTHLFLERDAEDADAPLRWFVPSSAWA